MLYRPHLLRLKISFRRTVNHSILLSKLHHYGIKVQPIFQLDFFLKRKQYACLNGNTSELKPINYGVAQGSKIGPLLFLLYTNDLPNSVSCTPRIFADETCLLLSDPTFSNLIDNINKELDELSDRCNQSINFLDPLILGGSRGQQLELEPPSISILCNKG